MLNKMFQLFSSEILPLCGSRSAESIRLLNILIKNDNGMTLC